MHTKLLTRVSRIGLVVGFIWRTIRLTRHPTQNSGLTTLSRPARAGQTREWFMSTARLVMAVSFLSFMAPQTLMKIAFVGTKATATSTTKTIQAAGRATNEGSVAKRADRSGLIDGMYSSCVVRFFFLIVKFCVVVGIGWEMNSNVQGWLSPFKFVVNSDLGKIKFNTACSASIYHYVSVNNMLVKVKKIALKNFLRKNLHLY